MKNIVILLHVEAIRAAQQICATLPDCDLYIFDPLLGDAASGAGFANIRLFTALGGPPIDAIDRDGNAAAHALEALLNVDCRGINCGVSVLGWQQQNLAQIFITLQWYAGLWERMGPLLPPGRVHVPMNDNPADYYFNSFLPAVSLVSYLQKRSIEVVSYTYGAKPAAGNPIPHVPGTARENAAFLLTHLPTSMYDSDYFAAELRSTGMQLVNLKSALWDSPVPADRQIELADAETGLANLSVDLRARLEICTAALTEKLLAHFKPYIGLAEPLARQAAHIAGRYRAQLIAHHELQRHFAEKVPDRLVLSQHDTGFLGPLMGFAEHRSLPVVILPHSKFIGGVEFIYRNVVALTHPMQTCGVRATGGKPVLCFPIAYPERFASSSAVTRGVREVCLLLNAPSLNGVPYARFDAYLRGITELVNWCRTRDVRIKIRCKPGWTLFEVLRSNVGIDIADLVRAVTDPLEEHVNSCDLCLMYDLPTSGALSFLRSSVPVLNPAITVPPRDFAAMVNRTLIVPEGIDETLRRLDEFRADPRALDTFRAAQFLNYISHFHGARALRAFL